jgi:hypothetical protein
MAQRQDGRVTVHFDPGDGFPVCGQLGSVLLVTDPRHGEDDDFFTICGKCMKQPRWRLAWKDATRKATAP